MHNAHLHTRGDAAPPSPTRKAHSGGGSGLSSKMNYAIAVIGGMCVGAALQANVGGLLYSRKAADGRQGSYTTKGMVRSLDDVPERPTSHVDMEGRPITKQQFLEPFVVPNFVGYSVATFKPGQTMMPVHEHESMHEFFYVLEGTGVFQVNGVDHNVQKGTFLHMAPHDKHGIWVPKESTDGDLKLAVCGVTLD